MTARRALAAMVLSIASAVTTPALAIDNPKVWTDLGGDANSRRTDPELIGAINPGATLPNLVKLSIGAWQTNSPFTDPYTGSYANPVGAHLFRIDLEFRGVVNPPGPATFSNYNPFVFGPSPLYGFIELNVDGERDTGGEMGSAAKSKYLANIGRFGRIPQGSIQSRAARYGWEIDSSFWSAPQIERSGADFLLAFCGCYETWIISETGNANSLFEAGETWLIRGGFFQRAGGYQGACGSSGGAGGLQPGMYVPWVKLRWAHSMSTNSTIVTLVYAIDMDGAGQLAGQVPQAPNTSVDDQTSIVEALTDLIEGVPNVPSGTATWELSRLWNGRNASSGPWLDPTSWQATALVGTAYVAPQEGAVFVWTDTGFEDAARDLNGDGNSTEPDKQAVNNAIAILDGSIWDADGQHMQNEGVSLVAPGINFAAEDVDGDGHINRVDLWNFCPADVHRDGIINILDYLDFFNAYTFGDLKADLNTNGVLEPTDYVSFLNGAAQGC